jgi:signal transduction histidine kinase
MPGRPSPPYRDRVRWAEVHRVDPVVRDWWPVVLVGVLTQLVTVEDAAWGGLSPLAPTLLGLATALPLRWRRDRPVLVVALLAATVAVTVVVVGSGDPPFAAFVALLIACFSVGQHAPMPAAAVALAVPALPVTLMFVTGTPNQPQELVFPIFYFGGAWSVGRLVRRRHEVARRMEGLVGALERERDENARLAAEAERQRIAREVHDVVAHSLGVISIHAEAAEALLERGSPDVSRPVAVIRTTSRDALEELRGVLGGMRAEQPSPHLGMAELPALVARFREAGVAVTLDVGPVDEPGPLPEAVESAAYRLVQEGLTNALRHARGASVSVWVSRDEDGLAVAVHDDGRGVGGANSHPPGFGLAGMRERVARLGGQLRAGPTEDGAFAVDARLPVATSPR